MDRLGQRVRDDDVMVVGWRCLSCDTTVSEHIGCGKVSDMLDERPNLGDRWVCLDLFSGLGGFSQAFEESDRWEVYTVEIEEQFNPDLCADVFGLRPADLLELVGEHDRLVVLASPPCTVFSPAGNHELWDADEREPAAPRSREHVALVHHTVGLIHSLSPDFWYLENPTGRMQWVLGRPTGQVTYCQYGRDYRKSTDLWGHHAPMNYHSCPTGADCHEPNTEDDGTSAVASMSRDHAERSMVPNDLSEAIREAVEGAFRGEPVVAAQATLPVATDGRERYDREVQDSDNTAGDDQPEAA